MPSNLVGPNQRHWKAVTLSVESPWYLFVYAAEYQGQKVPQTTLVAWESTLLQLLESIPSTNHRAIGRLDKSHSPGVRWKVTWVETVWVASAEELEETGQLLLQVEGDPQLRDAHLAPVPTRGGRRLVFSHTPAGPGAPHAAVSTVPSDFPGGLPAGYVPGAQPKAGVREEAGAFTDGATARRAERYEICLDLFNQIVAYAEHKRAETPGLAVERLVEQLLQQVQRKRFGWGLSPAEAGWLSARVKGHFFQSG